MTWPWVEDGGNGGEARAAAVLRAVAVGLLVVSVLLVVVAVVLPPGVLSWLRSDYWQLGRPLNWLDMTSSRIDLTHVVLFAWLSLLACCLWPRTPWWRIALPLLGLAVATEILQWLVPGRTPRWGDVVDDLLGIACGLVLAVPIRWMLRRHLGS